MSLEDRTVSDDFTGLLASAQVALGVMGIGTIIFEVGRRWKRKTIRRIRKEPGEDQEDFEMAGYLYTSRNFVPFRPSPKHSKWPLAWVWQVIPLDNKFYISHCGLDSAVYVLLLRGCFMFTLVQALTVLPILLPIHLIHSPESYKKTEIARASLTALVSNDTNKHLLFVHVILLWWMTACWMVTMLWLGRAVIRSRKWSLNKLKKEAEEKTKEKQQISFVKGLDSEEHRGWRHRSVVVTNLPLDMRDESTLIQYFTEELNKKRPTDDRKDSPTYPPPQAVQPHEPQPPSPILGKDADEPLITRVVLIRRTFELHEIHRKREEVLHQLERAHIYLARRALRGARDHIEKKEKLEKHGAVQPSAVERLSRNLSVKRKFKEGGVEKVKQSFDEEKAVEQGMDLLVKTLAPFLPNYEDEPTDLTIWEALLSLPSETLDRFQPVYQLRHLFKGQSVPAIDYFLTKYNLLTALLDDLRSSPNETYSAGPTAFVTFERASVARRAVQELRWHPTRSWACKVRSAPDVRDIEWDKVVKMSFRGDVLRGLLVGAGVWLFILLWVIPVTLLLSLFSLDNISNLIPGLAEWLAVNPRSRSLISSLVPTILLAILTFLVPTLIIQFSHRGQHFFTVSKLHHAVLCRYWKFLMTDVVIVFCAGASAVEAVFQDPGEALRAATLLDRIASTFPTGATFFIHWQIIVAGIHPFFELMLFGFPMINHFGVHGAATPRKRLNLALPRHINIYYWLPNHLTVISIVFIFALLNPLVVAFNLIYFTLALIVFKRSFGFYYWTRHYQLNGKMIFIRFFRYSLDGLLVGQIVLIALLWVSKASKYGTACIPVPIFTAFFKLLGTRLFNAYTSTLDVREADIVCGKDASRKEPSRRRSLANGVEEVSIPLAPSFLSGLRPLGRLTWRIKLHPAVDRHLGEMSMTQSGTGQRIPASKWKFWKAQVVRKALRNSGLAFAEEAPILSKVSSNASTSTSDSVQTLTDDTRTTPPLDHCIKDPFTAKPLPTVSEAKTEPLDLPRVTLTDQPASVRPPGLAQPHPRLVRDDRTDFSARYENPFLAEPLCRNMWLPRHPLGPIDLNDSIDWYGSALVSSAGGSGRIGSVEEETESVKDDLEVIRDQQLSLAEVTSPGRRASVSASPYRPSPRRTMSSMSKSSESVLHQRLQGDERIQIAEQIRNRLDDGETEETSESLLPVQPVRKLSSATTGSVAWDSSVPSSTISSRQRAGSTPSDHSSVGIIVPKRRDTNANASLRATPSMLSPGRTPTFRRQASVLSETSDGGFIRRDTIRAPSRKESISQREALREEVLHELQKENLSRAKKKEDDELRAERRRRVLGWATFGQTQDTEEGT